MSLEPPAKYRRTSLNMFRTSYRGIYVERKCAPIQVLRKKLMPPTLERQPVVMFLGPQGCGKTTTLKRLCTEFEKEKVMFIDVRSITPDDECFFRDLCSENVNEDIIVLVDNAQLLGKKENDSHVTSCIDLLNVRGRAVCLAFSPVIVEPRGDSVVSCPIKATERVYFTPFTEEEIQDYCTKAKCQQTALTSYIPEYATQELAGAAVRPQLIAVVQAQFRKLRGELPPGEFPSLEAGLSKALLYGSKQLSEVDSVCLVQSGLAYTTDESSTCQLVYPTDILHELFSEHINSMFKTMCEFGVGVAYDFLFYSKVLGANDVSAHCLGKQPRAFAGKLQKDSIININCKRHYLQPTYGAVPSGTELSSTISKLAQGHVAIDFLILNDGGSQERRKLYFVQVSAMKYQHRAADRRRGAVLEESQQLKGKSPLEYYSSELSVKKQNCFFVYATPEVPETYTGEEADFVYFAKLK